MSSPKKLEIGVVPVVTTSASQAAQAVADILYKFTILGALDTFTPYIKNYLGQNEYIADQVSKAKLSDIPSQIETELNSNWINIINLLKAGVTSGSGSLFSSVYESLSGTQYLLSTYNGFLHQVGIAPFVQRYYMEKYRPTIPDEDTLITLTRYKRMKPDDYFKYMSYHGYSTDLSHDLFAAAQRPIDISRATEIFWRAKIDADAYKQILKENMVRDEHLDFFIELTDLIPPPQDLIQMVVREAFDPKQVVTAPATFTEYMSKKGFRSVWSDRYWTAHFFRAAIGRIEDRYCRGVLTETELRAWYTLADIHPNDHTHLIGTIYSAPSRLDARFGYATGVYEHADLVRFNRMRRMSPEDADDSARAQELYLLRDEVTKMASAAETDFVDGVIDESELRANLTALWFSPEEVNYRVALAVWKKEAALRRIPTTRLKNVLADEITRMAKADEQDLIDEVIDESTFRADLRVLQFTDAEIDYRIALCLHAREMALRRIPKTTTKNVLGDEILRMASAAEQDLVDDVIDESTFRADLAALQFTESEIDYRVSLGIHKRNMELRRSAITVAKTQYQYGKITEQQLRQQLIDLKVAADRVELIITELSAKKKQTTTEVTIEKKKKLSEAKVATARDLGLIGDTEYVRRLEALDYTPEDANLLLRIELTPRPVSPEELARRRRTIEARLNRAIRRYDLQLTRITTEIQATDKERADLDIISKESIDIIDTQIAILEREIVEFLSDEFISRVFLRVLSRDDILRMKASDVTRQIHDVALPNPELAALVPDNVRSRLNNWKILRERREFAVASYDKRFSDLVQRKTDLVEMLNLIQSQRAEEISEYEDELKLVVGG